MHEARVCCRSHLALAGKRNALMSSSMAMSPSWTGSQLREMLIGWNEGQLTWLKEQIEGELTVRAWLKRGQRAQPDLAPGSGSPGSLEWSELPDGWQVTVCCRSCEYRMSAKVRPWRESHRHLKLCGWTLSSDAYWYCRDHTQLQA